ncbi:MAG: thymidine phosphorylase [Lachnospiraceae bacterium]|nr:thymidine phosphorylase [Lachnospiraceae bacterium]
MNMYDIITKKKHGEELTDEEIAYVVKGYKNGDIPDYQVSALVMAICLKGMNIRETAMLTLCMRDSGSIMDLSSIPGLKADKHSTGGVGDKVSLIVGPMVAALGVPVAKMSGRGLGHTGGTIDKLESIPGFSVSLSTEQFLSNVKRMQLAIVGQTADLAPADKKLYALRDVTATVDNISLIASSIMSKKLASGSDVIVLDVTTGSGAFMKTVEDAITLAETMVQIGIHAGKKVYAVITDMNQVLGHSVGNSLEVIEAIEALHGKSEVDLTEACMVIAGLMLVGCGKAADLKEAGSLLKIVIADGSAFRKFREFITAQGGDVAFIDDTNRFKKAKYSHIVKAEEDGYIASINAERIGRVSVLLGAGRETKDAPIDPSAGIHNYCKVGDFFKKGDTLAVLYADEESLLDGAEKYYRTAYTVSAEPVSPLTTIYGFVDETGFHTF